MTDKKDEALKLALDAFETLTQYNMVRANIFRRFEPTCTGDYVDLKEFREKAEPAITALREALTEQPAQPARKPLTLGQKQRLWGSVGDKPTLKDRVNAYGTAIEAAHGIRGTHDK